MKYDGLKKEQCTGCGVCSEVCPKNCISMEYDVEGFLYPTIDETKCIDCKKCISVCHYQKKADHPWMSDNPICYASYGKDVSRLKEASSGGVFELLANRIIDTGGIVYGAYLDQELVVRHGRATSSEGIKKFRKSKYLQSNMTGIFCFIKKDLDNQKEVLFSGTPCQVAALYSFLGKKYNNLITVDIVCHGVPSEYVFRRYICWVEEKYQKKVKDVCWRDKESGWRPNHISIVFDDRSVVSMTSNENPMQWGFLNDLYLRPSCYNCKYARIPRIGDITLGDFWGYEGELLVNNDNKGISMVVLSSKKGKELYDQISNRVIDEKSELQYCVRCSYHLTHPPKYNNKREEFMRDFVGGNVDFVSLCKEYLYDSGWPESTLLDLLELINTL